MTELTASSHQGRPRIRSTALPLEHGGWGFLLEPLLLGLLAAPSTAGVWLALSTTAVFLIHQPLKIAMKDRIKGKSYARTSLAWRFVWLYSAVGAAAFALALAAAEHPFWQPLLLAAPFALVQLRLELANRGRELLPETAGALALLISAPVLALAGGWEMLPALALWVILAIRTVVSILYVRARLRLERGEAIQSHPILASHFAGLLFTALMAAAHVVPWTVTAAAALLFGRAAYGLSRYRRPARAKIVGFQEMGYGLLLVAAAALGYHLGL